jgi:hypothetical protein
MATLNTTVPVAAQAPAQNTDAVITLTTPTDNTAWKIRSISWSYSAAPTGGQVVIAWGAVSMTFYVTAAGPGQLIFQAPIILPNNTGGTITLKAGSGTVVGTVYANADNG